MKERWAVEELFTVQETADYLKTSRAQIYNFMNDGSLPFILIGKHRRIKESDLIAFVEAAQRGSGKDDDCATIEDAPISQRVAA
jgi:excisionase family DNA binding protein